MATPFRTTRKSEVLWALPYLVDLVRDVLTEEEYLAAEKIAVNLVRSKKTQKAALEQLKTLVAPPPKQPLEYAQKELMELPRFTRDAVKYLGDYITLLVRAWSQDVTGDAGSQTRSLGTNIRNIEPKKFGIDHKIIDQLKRYNSFIYTPSRHDFTITKGQRHRFTTREVVLIAVVTMKLANQIKELSPAARLQSILM